jgi:nucleoid DNA-binding protein
MVTKDTLVQEMTCRMGYPKTRVKEIIDSMVEIMKSTLESGEDILISSFICATNMPAWGEIPLQVKI